MSDLRRWAARAVLTCVALAGTTGCIQPKVTRMVDGREIEGRFISAYAYTYYAYGADAEARGDLEGALASYEEAASEDGDSAQLWTRIGALRCQLSRSDWEDAFDEASGIDERYEPIARERAKCALLRGRLEEALDHADRAVGLDPERVATFVLRATILERLGRTKLAWLELVALTVRHPRSVDAWRARFGLASRLRSEPERLRAAQRLQVIGAQADAEIHRAVPELSPQARMDAALLAGDLAAARRASKEARTLAADLAARAAALGQVGLAQEQADLVLTADPTSATARIALAVAADLAGDPRALRTSMTRFPGPGRGTPPSELARWLFAELLVRRLDRDAAQLWLEGSEREPGNATPKRANDPPVDPLLAEVKRRVKKTLAESAP